MKINAGEPSYVKKLQNFVHFVSLIFYSLHWIFWFSHPILKITTSLPRMNLSPTTLNMELSTVTGLPHKKDFVPYLTCCMIIKE